MTPVVIGRAARPAALAMREASQHKDHDAAMPASFTVLVRNASQTKNYFYIFQKISSFSTGSPADVTCSCLGCAQIGNYTDSGSQIEFRLDAQIYAGAISTAQTTWKSPVRTLRRSATLNISTTSSAVQPIALTTQPNDSISLNYTVMSLNPLGLSRPQNAPEVSTGSFGIQVPPYTPLPTPFLFCGNAATLKSGTVILSSFISAPQNQLLCCTPQSIYFVKVGEQPEGSPVHYDTTASTCATCDFTTGNSTIIVQYNVDGTFSIVSST
ncbi:hypothetical protein [Methylobacterium tarhaniae]|uniref:hypothetical protein n=1 Tax=Methylobacterium tarhaniae TaxID=1187852 RepID=UPI000A7653B1|nr:hypothetical protein [Methylobacterium tarhaniae]